jgi:hypothetical protein
LLVIGPIDLSAASQTAVNFQGGNWLFAIAVKAANGTLAGTAVNTNGAPFVVSGQQVAVLDPTSFALADRALTNFTGEVQQALQGRFDGMGVVGGGNAALRFAGSPSTPGIADQATEAFSAIPSVAMSYASDPRPAVGKAPAAATPYYDTTVWLTQAGCGWCGPAGDRFGFWWDAWRRSRLRSQSAARRFPWRRGKLRKR